MNKQLEKDWRFGVERGNDRWGAIVNKPLPRIVLQNGIIFDNNSIYLRLIV